MVARGQPPRSAETYRAGVGAYRANTPKAFHPPTIKLGHRQSGEGSKDRRVTKVANVPDGAPPLFQPCEVPPFGGDHGSAVI
jgi:hypothetical protein